MSEEKDDLKSIKVYRFNNTKESWHEFALKFRVIADYRGYDDIISGKEIAPSEKENLEIMDEDNELTKKSKKAKQSARTANRKGFRDLVMATDGVILVIKERLRSRSCNVAEVEQLLEDKYLSMKCVKGWEEEEDDYALFASPAKKKGPKKTV